MQLRIAAMAFAMSIASANAGVILCDAPKVLIGDEPDNNPVVMTEVSYKPEDHAWRIFHHRADGSVVPRAEQYAITDRSNADRLQWTGSLNRNRNLVMIGEVKQKGAQIFYYEWLYDRAKGNQLVMHAFAACQQPQRPMERPSSEVTPQVKPPVLAYDGSTVLRGSAEVKLSTKGDKLKPVRDAVPIHSYMDGKAVRIDVILGGQPVRMMIDTGATISLITRDLAHRIVMDGQGAWGPTVHSQMADSRVVSVPSVIIRSVRIGNHEIKNVQAAITDGDSLLVAFPVLNSIGPFTINTRTRELIFDTSMATAN